MTSQYGVENPENVSGGRNRSPEQIQREIGETRGRIDSGLHELDERLGSGDAIREAASHVRESAGEWSASVGRAIRDNPVPAFLIGAGAAWIAISALSRTPRGEALRHRTGEQARDLSHRAGEHARDLSHRASDVAHRASERAHDLGHRASEAASHAKERAADLGHRARERANQVGHRASETFESQPLLIGALGLAVGAAIGASIPSTRREDELVGPYRDRLKHDAAEFGREQIARAGDVAHDAVESARREAGKAIDEATRDLEETKGEAKKNGQKSTTGA